jgi:hypothetical protein
MKLIYVYPWGSHILRDVRCHEILDEKVIVVVGVKGGSGKQSEEYMNCSVVRVQEPGLRIKVIPSFGSRRCDRGSFKGSLRRAWA